MKRFKKTIVFLLLAVMLVSVMAMPAMALSTTEYAAVKSEVASFPQIGYLSSNQTYVYALQAYLL